MKKLLTLGMVTALLLAACAVYAVPTLVGPTGTFNAPSGTIACPGELDLAVAYMGQTYSGGDSSWPLRVLYGVGGNFEIGAAYDVNGIDKEGIWYLNAKYLIPYKYCDTGFVICALYGESGTINVNVEDQNFGSIAVA